jgi:hypothetical protein
LPWNFANLEKAGKKGGNRDQKNEVEEERERGAKSS